MKRIKHKVQKASLTPSTKIIKGLTTAIIRNYLKLNNEEKILKAAREK